MSDVSHSSKIDVNIVPTLAITLVHVSSAEVFLGQSSCGRLLRRSVTYPATIVLSYPRKYAHNACPDPYLTARVSGIVRRSRNAAVLFAHRHLV